MTIPSILPINTIFNALFHSCFILRTPLQQNLKLSPRNLVSNRSSTENIKKFHPYVFAPQYKLSFITTQKI